MDLGFFLSFSRRTKIEMKGTLKGLDPVQFNYLNEQMGKLKNLIEETAIQISIQDQKQTLSNELEKLVDFYTRGILSDDEFRRAKEKILK
jgi:hypothetical protein